MILALNMKSAATADIVNPAEDVNHDFMISSITSPYIP